VRSTAGGGVNPLATTGGVAHSPPFMRGSVSRRRSSAWIAIVALLPFGCGRQAAVQVADGSAARAQALIDAGNQAYRTGNYALAARRFGAAAVVRDDDAAAFYGLGMALQKLGRDEDARVAYARARRLSETQRVDVTTQEPDSTN
jgi:Tfp pilus assembly protein PilF